MKRVTFVVTYLMFLLLTINGLSQQYPVKLENSLSFQHPAFKAYQQHKAGFKCIPNGNHRYINTVIADSADRCLYYFTVYGAFVDSVYVDPVFFRKITTKACDAALPINTVLAEEMNIANAGIEWIRTFGGTDIKVADAAVKSDESKKNLGYVKTALNIPAVLHAKSTFEKTVELNNFKKYLLLTHQFANLHCNVDDTAQHPQGYVAGNIQEIAVSGDTLLQCFNKDDLSYVSTITGNYKTNSLLVQNDKGDTLDIIKLKKDGVRQIAALKTDVFALYYGWLEWKLQNSRDIAAQAQEKLLQLPLNISTTTDSRQTYEEIFKIAQLQEQEVLQKIDYTLQINAANWIKPVLRPSEGLYSFDPYMETFMYVISKIRGEKQYQLTDHRGNVMATISDKKKAVANGTNLGYYVADIISATDYYPFGAPMQGRTFNSEEYAYGYNGKRNDKETGYQDYGFRIYDPYLGRFLSVDPLKGKYPELSPYQFASNSPIGAIDLDGLEAKIAIAGQGQVGTTHYSTADNNANEAWATMLRVNGFEESKAHTGSELLGILKKATKKEGGINTIVSFSHAGPVGIYLNSDEGFYGNKKNAGDVFKAPIGPDARDIDELKKSINSGEINFNQNALWIFAGCQTNYSEDYFSIAYKLALDIDITTIGATGFANNVVKNGKGTDEWTTTGTWIYTRRVYTLNYFDSDNNLVNTYTAYSQKQADSYDKAFNYDKKYKLRSNTSVEKKDLGKTINLKNLTKKNQ